MNKQLLFFVCLLILPQIALADYINVSNISADLGSGVYINVTGWLDVSSLTISSGQLQLNSNTGSIILIPTNSINFTLTTWNTTGDYYKKLNITGNATITAGDNPHNARMQIRLNGSNYAIVNTNSTGYFTYSFTDGAGEHQLEFSVIGTGVGNGSISYPAIAVAGVLGVAASVAIFTIWRRRNGGRMYGFIPFL